MPDYLNELETFWNEFAEEYEMIQQESTIPIAEELRDFLLSENLLPCQTFLDLAGGPGRYLSTIKAYVQKYDLVDLSAEMLKLAADKSDSNVQLIKNDQKNFLSQNKHRYNIVFSAMNPALQTKEELLAFCQASQEWCLILRVTTDEDQLFSPYEEINPDLLLNERYKAFLTELHIPYQTKKFAYTNSEEVTRDFFREYFTGDFSPTELVKITEKTFGVKQQKINQQFLDFELIYFHVPKTYNENGF